MNKIKLIFASTLVLLLAACASNPYQPKPEDRAAFDAFKLPDTPAEGKALVYVISEVMWTWGLNKNKPHGLQVDIGGQRALLDANEHTAFQVDPKPMRVFIQAQCFGDASALKTALEAASINRTSSGVTPFFYKGRRSDPGENFSPEAGKTYFFHANRWCFINRYDNPISFNTAGSISLVDEPVGRYLVFSSKSK